MGPSHVTTKPTEVKNMQNNIKRNIKVNEANYMLLPTKKQSVLFSVDVDIELFLK